MRGSGGFGWFGVAVAATLLVLNAGYDTSEGGDDLRTALRWLESGRIGRPAAHSGIFLQAPDGLYYPVHELGNILWLTPAAALGLAAEPAMPSALLAPGTPRAAEMPGTLMPVLFITGTALGFWKLLEWGFAATARTRLTASSLLVFATLLLPYSRSLSDVVATGCWITWAAACAARAAARGDRVFGAVAGLFLGCALLTRVPALVAVVPIAIWMIASAPRDRRVSLAAAAALTAMPCVAALLWFNAVRTGSPLAFPALQPQYVVTQPGSGSIATGIAGLLASPGKSLFLFAPVMLIAAAGLPRMLREARAAAVMVVSVFVLFVVLHGSLAGWPGDWAWGPRYFVFVIPVLFLPAVFALQGPHGRRARAAGTAIIALSIGVQAVALTIDWHHQYQLMWIDGRLPGSYWRADNQLTDGVRAAAANVARMAGSDVSMRDVPGESRLTRIAASGVNVWWVTALRAGLPPMLILPAAGALAAIAIAAWRRARRSVRV